MSPIIPWTRWRPIPSIIGIGHSSPPLLRLSLVDREERRSGWCDLIFGHETCVDSCHDFGPEKLEPFEQQDEVISGGGEYGIDGIAGLSTEVILILPMIGLAMADGR